ncbi:MAG: hypothetical protein ABI430_04450 [Candidatus Taylorbacteria bacterium]
MVSRNQIQILFVCSFFFALSVWFPSISFASATDGTIVNQYAWGEYTGWVNFAPAEGNIHITDTAVTGYAWDANYGWINLAPDQSGVLNDGNGTLSGFAWSQGGGYIDFSGVTVNSSGTFTGIATGAVYGRINFDCDNCSVTTDWRPASSRQVVTASTGRRTGGGGRSVFTSPQTNPIELDSLDSLSPNALSESINTFINNAQGIQLQTNPPAGDSQQASQQASPQDGQSDASLSQTDSASSSIENQNEANIESKPNTTDTSGNFAGIALKISLIILLLIVIALFVRFTLFKK